MGTQVTNIYRVFAVGTTSAKLFSFVASAPIDPAILQAFGLRVLSDVTTPAPANPLIRTIVLSFDPSATALVTPVVVTSRGRFESATVDVANQGLDYILPPIVRADNNARSEPLSKVVDGVTINTRSPNVDAILKAYMRVFSATVTGVGLSGGTGYVAASTRIAFLGGLPPADFVFDSRKVDPTTDKSGSVRRNFRGGCVRYINIKKPGRGYPAGTQLSIQGGGAAGTPPIAAQGILTLDSNGGVASIAIVNMGSDYVSVPHVTLTSPTGTQPQEVAELFALMAEGRPAQATAIINAAPPFDITGFVVTDQGDNYVTVPDMLITDPGGGTGAIARARMSAGRIDVIYRGQAYLPGTTVTATSAFQNYFPVDPADAQAQAAMFFKFLTGTIQQIAITPLNSDVPLVA